MSREEYEKILKEIKLPDVTITREDIIRVLEATVGPMPLQHSENSDL